MEIRQSLRVLSAVMLLVAAAFVWGCAPEDDPDQGGNGGSEDSIAVAHDCVDLGLPSGLLWATCNLGANSPEDCGDYYAWGETDAKELYDWKSYPYACFVNGRYVLTKYCTDSTCGYDGRVDGLTVLEAADDAARVNWGTDWRMATGEEWEELYRNTVCTWTTLNGVDGRLLTGRNGNSLFLPATGFRLDGELICTGLGIYWTSSLQTDSQVSAWSFHFQDENCHVCGTYERSRGQVVRAVRAVK